MFTVAEAAQQIGVCERTAWSYVQQRRLCATRISPRRTRVTQAAIDEFLFNCTDKPGAAVCCCAGSQGDVIPDMRGSTDNAA
jgi:hypothetical protein